MEDVHQKMNSKREKPYRTILEIFCLIVILVDVWLCFVVVPTQADKVIELQGHISRLEQNATRRENLIQAQVKALSERPVVYRYKTIYKELP